MSIPNTGSFPFITKTNLQKEPMRFNFRWKSSSSDVKTQKRDSGSQKTFKSKRVLNFHWFDECFIKMKQRFSILVEIQHFFGLTQPTNGFQILVNKGFQSSRLLSNMIFKHSLLYNTWLCFLKPWAKSSHEFSKNIS